MLDRLTFEKTICVTITPLRVLMAIVVLFVIWLALGLLFAVTLG